MKMLSLHSLGHDSGAAYVEDGRLVHSIETERLTRRRYDHRVRIAVDYILGRPDVDLEAIDLVAVTSPVRNTFLQIPDLDAVMARLARGDQSVLTTCRIRSRTLPCVVVTHEVSHAALALHYADYDDDCLVFVNEGRGQFSQCSAFVHRRGQLEWVDRDLVPWYGRGLGWTGLGVLFGMGDTVGAAGKLMAMGAYGQPSAGVREFLVQVEDRVTTDRRYAESVARQMRERGLADTFQNQADLVATHQNLFTEAVSGTVLRLMREQECTSLALGGGCALNIIANSALRDALGRAPAIPPACNDAGHPIGAAIYVLWALHGRKLQPFSVYANGGAQSSEEAADAFLAAGYSVQPLDLEVVARVLAGGGVVALHQDRAESGPRALGNRSLLASPEVPGMRKLVSEGIKSREWYRPLAAVLTDEAHRRQFPDLPFSPHMLFNYSLAPDQFPQARHVDGTSRLQTVSHEDNPKLHELLTVFERVTGVPALINTSLNAAGRAIVQTHDDMITDFARSKVDLMVGEGVMAWTGNDR